MSKAVSRGQALQVTARVATQVNWEELDGDQLQTSVIDLPPEEFGRRFTRFLQNGGRVEIVTLEGVIAPTGGKVHVVTVPVDESRPWSDAISAAGPDTDLNSDIWKMGGQYPPQAGAGTKNKEIILVNFGKAVSSETAIAWGKEQGLRPKSPRACLAVGERHPNLHRDLGLNEMVVVSLAPCSFEGRQQFVCCWWRGSERSASLCWLALGWRASFWFAFSRE